ncbi:MAG: phosphoribosylformylglycinamidine synthase subunit PurL [Planctomycetes bacterium]|nr:phosphoribosylformylglycinamidine synthase subunit PurL [Planctomycetota bacterium]
MTTTHVVEVTRRDADADPEAQRVLRALNGAGHPARAVRVAWVYELAADALDAGAAERVARALLQDPVLDEARLAAAPTPREGEAVVTVLRRPGVMDPVALSAVDAARDVGVTLRRVRTARRIYVEARDGAPSDGALAWLVRRLANPVVDQAVIGAGPLPDAGAGADRAAGPLRREVPLLGLDPDALVRLSRERVLALDAAEMGAVRDHFAGLGREPTELELETIAQTWSEHCKHKTLTGPIDYEEKDEHGGVVASERISNLLKTTIFAATQELALDRCLSVFVDNAGVVRFDERLGVAVKVETHNHPSAIEPYGGAGTGVGGVIRDILGTGLGADPILNLDVFCVGDLEAAPDAVPPGSIHPRTVLEGVVAGVRDYGNRMGIPTVCGALVTEPRYVGNPLVFCGTVGLIPVERVSKAARPGDWVVVVGGRTGRDGVHGATFSSDALSTASEVESGGAVQIGNPIAQKMLADVLLHVRDRGWLSAVTDCGAGGLSSAVGEMAAEVGARVDLARAPLKYAGLAPWEVWVSEAQERMVLAVPPEHGQAVMAAFAAEDVEATHLGDFTGDGRLVVTWGDEVVGELDLAFLHDGLPRQARRATWTRRAFRPARIPSATRAGEALRRILAAPTVASKEWLIRQYDHEVQGATAIKPLVGARAAGPSDGIAVVPLLDVRGAPGDATWRRPKGRAPRGVVVGLGVNPRHGRGDPYLMATSVIDEALRNLVATGADPDAAAVLDNFSWGDARRPEVLGELVRAARACRDAALAYRVPFISGKDSLNNEYELPDGRRVAIPGTLLITAVAVVPDATRLVTMDLKGPGHAVYLVGLTRPELLGSLFLEAVGAHDDGLPPTVDLERAPEVLRRAHRAIATGDVLAAHDLSEGGLAVAAAEMAFAGGVGLSLDLEAVPHEGGADDLTLLFSESPTRLLLEVPPGATTRLEAALAGVPFARVGTTEPTGRLRVRGRGGATLLDESLTELQAVWREPLYALYGA